MSRRSTPQKQIDERAFPVKVRVKVPEFGFGNAYGQIEEWLRTNLERGDYARHSDGRSSVGDVSAYYFRDTAVADRFVKAMDVELADGTTCLTYKSPALPFGRR